MIVSANMLAVGNLLEAFFEDKEVSINDLIEISGFSQKAVRHWIKMMHKREKNFIYICRWVKSGTNNVARYKLGYCMPDVSPKPEALPRAVTKRDADERLRIRQGRGTLAMCKARTAAGRSKRMKEQPRDPLTRQLIKKTEVSLEAELA